MFDELFTLNANNSNGLLGLNNEDNQLSGLLGMALMNNDDSSNPLAPLFMLEMMGNNSMPPNAIGNVPRSSPNASGYSPSPSTVSNLPSDKSALLQQLKASAESAFPGNPTMQQVAITQAIHESGLMGKPSALASQNNNLFGIKAPGTAGTVRMQTSEYRNGSPTTENAGFGRNASAADSFVQYKNLMNKTRYAPVMQSETPSDAFTALQRSGYATDPRYANKLNNVYQRYVAPLY